MFHWLQWSYLTCALLDEIIPHWYVPYCTSFKHGGTHLTANVCILNLAKKIYSIPVCMAFPFTDQHLSSSMHCSVTARDVWRRRTSITMSVTSWHFPVSIPVRTLQLFSNIHHNHPLLYIALHDISVHLCNGVLLSHDFYFKMKSPTQYLCMKYVCIPIRHWSPNCSPPGFIM
jgi:hypothetical protein